MKTTPKRETFDQWWLERFATLGKDSVLKIGYRAAFNAGRRAERKKLKAKPSIFLNEKFDYDKQG